MQDFFISYTAPDKHWAQWIAWQLEEAGYTTLIQIWDFNPGSNFVLEMNNASAIAAKTIAVLSEEYLTKAFPAAEWSAAFVNDPAGGKHKLIPVRVEDVSPGGLLSSLVYIDLFNCIDESAAKKTLLSGVSGQRTKPVKAPQYPVKKCFKPNQCATDSRRRSVGCPKVGNSKFEIEIRIQEDFDSFSDREKEKFLLAVKELLNIHYDVKITKISRGSVIVRLELNKVDALCLYTLLRNGELKGCKVSDVKIVKPKDLTANEINARQSYCDNQRRPA